MFNAASAALCLLTLASPVLAQTGCPTGADLDRGIEFTFSTGSVEVYRRTAAGVVAVNGVGPDGQIYRMELAHGAQVLLYENIVNGVPEPGSRVVYDYGLPPAQIPEPVSGENWQAEATVTASGGSYVEAQTRTTGKPQNVVVAGCAYAGFDVLIAYATDDHYTENLRYLPALGLGYLLWKKTDGNSREVVSALAIRVAK